MLKWCLSRRGLLEDKEDIPQKHGDLAIGCCTGPLSAPVGIWHQHPVNNLPTAACWIVQIFTPSFSGVMLHTPPIGWQLLYTIIANSNKASPWPCECLPSPPQSHADIAPSLHSSGAENLQQQIDDGLAAIKQLDMPCQHCCSHIRLQPRVHGLEAFPSNTPVVFPACPSPISGVKIWSHAGAAKRCLDLRDPPGQPLQSWIRKHPPKRGRKVESDREAVIN